MVSSRFLFIFSSNTLLLMITQAFAQPAPFLKWFCLDDKGSYTTNSTYQRNLNTLLTSLLTSLPASKNSTGYGFYYSSFGENPNRVYAIGHCRGDIATDDCHSCLNDSRVGLTELCPNQKEAISWKDNCMLRYSYRSIYGIMETTPYFILINAQNVSSSLVEVFFQQLGKLLESLRSQAAFAGPLRKFAFGNTNAGGLQNIYALTQCMPDLSEQECSDCFGGPFGGAFKEFASCCSGKIGGRYIRPSCNFAYESYPFIDPANVIPLPSPIFPPQPSTNTNPTGSKGNKSRTIMIVVVSMGALMALIISIFICLRARKTNKMLETKFVPGEDVDEIHSSEALQFDFDTIRDATYNFS